MSQKKKLNLCDYINLFTYFFFALIDLIKYFSLFCFSINYFLLTGETCNHFYFLFFIFFLWLRAASMEKEPRMFHNFGGSQGVEFV
jgi:hypothetical protein